LAPARWRLSLAGREVEAWVHRGEVCGDVEIAVGGRRSRLAGRRTPSGLFFFLDGRAFQMSEIDPLAEATALEEDLALFAAPMPGRIVRCPVEAGAAVEAGTVLIVLEAMKMEHALKAPAAGRLSKLRVREGEQVDEGTVLLDFDAEAIAAAG
jgi:3-methylcrotonyl-CoA carboxylase alpha subunit